MVRMLAVNTFLLREPQAHATRTSQGDSPVIKAILRQSGVQSIGGNGPQIRSSSNLQDVLDDRGNVTGRAIAVRMSIGNSLVSFSTSRERFTKLKMQRR
jgi:hypothetical protein